jgi:hypothetical protein
MTHWVEQYLTLEYEDGARGPERYDCWGLVRHVLHAHLGGRLMPSWGHVRNTSPRLFTRAYRAESASMLECAPCVGAIAAVFQGAIVRHVGIVVEIEGRLRVLEMNPSSGVRHRSVPDFEAPYLRVVYYRDR